MRLIYTADIHAAPQHLAALIETAQSAMADAIIIGGDIIPHHLPQFSGLDLIAAQAAYLQSIFIPAFEILHRSNPMPVFLDMGNDDLAANRPLLEQHHGRLFHLIHMQCLELTPGVDLIGYMIVPPTPFQRKDWEKPDTKAFPRRLGGQVRTHGFTTHQGYPQERVLDLNSADTIEADLARLSKKVRGPFIFVAHSPPADTPLDITGFGIHVGSQAIRDFIAHWARQGLLIAALHGHIHEAPVISGIDHTHIDGALCINPGQSQGANALLRYVLLELNPRRKPPAIDIMPGEMANR
ncbi:MAG: metallophosphoesterase [Desulfobacteraceae bacterium]|nr:metallophosphoesterase [Desulfobacteraceae bacterium]